MICPRCEKDTMLWVQKITQDKFDRKTKKVKEEGDKVFICEPCKGDWISASSLFKIYWKKSRGRAIMDQDYHQLYSMFVDCKTFRSKSDKRKLAQGAVAVAGLRYGEFSKRQAIFIPDADLITNEDYAWAAGFIDACGGAITDPENPGKICVIVKHPRKILLERLEDLLGGNQLKQEGSNWVYTTTKRHSETLLKRLQPYFKCTNEIHPIELSDDDRTLAWIAGFAQGCGKDGVIHTDCKWAVRLMGTLFSGTEVSSGEDYHFTPEDGMVEKLRPFLFRKLDPESARGPSSGSDPRKVAAFLSAGGEDRALGIPKGSHPERPAGPKPNSVAGLTPAEEGSHVALEPKPNPQIPPSSVWEPEAKPDLTPEIEVSGDTQVRLSLTSESCLVCRYILSDLQKDKGIMKGGKEVTLLGKIAHLYAEFEIELLVECYECEMEVPLRKWKDDFSSCGACEEPEVVVTNEPVDDKKWASV